MDAVVRSRRPLLIAKVGLLLASGLGSVASACGPSAPEPTVGVSDRLPSGLGVGKRGDAGAFVDGAALLPPDYRTKFTKVNKARFVSQGHAAGRWDVDVWANDAAREALEKRLREVPVGAVVVQEHFERGEGSPRGPVMVMEKRAPGFAPQHGDWRWAVVGAAGQRVSDGVVETCAGCHDDAPLSGLFPIVD